MVLLDTRATSLIADPITKKLRFTGSHVTPPTLENPQVGGFLLLWNAAMGDVAVKEISDRIVDVELVMPRLSRTLHVTNVYVPPQIARQTQVWTDLLALSQNMHDDWLVCGDFNNIIMHPHEKLGGNRPNWNRMQNFRDCISNCGLEDLGYCGPLFTWSNRQFGPSFICE